MSDDLEDVSVVETVDNTPSAEPAPVAVEPVVETSSEPVHADEQVFVASTKIGTAEDYTRQQVAEENGTALGNGNGDGRTLTEAGRHAKAAAAEEEKDRKLDAIKASQKDWLDKPDHDFGGIKMSGHDLARMIDFISNPQMQDKLRERLGKTGMPKDKIDKGMKELNEYIELKKKEQEGQKLTEEQQRRLKELEKSDEFKAVAAAAAQQARENGIELKASNDVDAIRARTSNNHEEKSVAGQQIKSQDNNSASAVDSARALFASAPHLSDEFTAKVAVVKPAPIANDVNNGFDTTAPAAVVAQAQVKSKTIDVSFG